MADTRDSKITSAGQWMVLTAALLGWLFDGAEMGLFSLIGRPAILNLLIDEELSTEELDRLFAAVQNSTADVLRIDGATVTPEARLESDLGAKPDDFERLAERLEKNFRIEIRPGELAPQKLESMAAAVAKDGLVTSEGIAVLKQKNPYLDFEKFAKDPKLETIHDLFTVRSLVNFVRHKLAELQVGPLFGLVIAGFLVGAATGGVLFGWLGDRIGRVRAMSLSVVTYAVFTGLCGLSTSAEQIAALRFIAALGMGGEWSLGVALVMEVWPNRSRALMAGLIGAAANVGYLGVGVLGLMLNSVLHRMEDWLQFTGVSPEWSKELVAYSGWRIMMLLGTLPALLTFFFRLFVPESEKWHHEKGRGTTSNWQTKDLFGVLLGATGPMLIVAVWSKQFADLQWSALGPTRAAVTIVGLVIATAGYLYPVVRFLKRLQEQSGQVIETSPVVRRMLLAAGLSAVALLGTWASTQWVPTWASQLVSNKQIVDGWTDVAKDGKEYAQICLALGAIFGTILAALCGDWFGRRRTYCVLCLTSLLSVFWMFQGHTAFGGSFLLAAFVSGMLTASFYGWLPLYLPELFGTKFRATGQGFSFNFGRIIAAIGALQAGLLSKVEGMTLFGRDFPGGYPLACTAMSLIYLVGMGLIWTMPETKGQPLPE